VQNVFKDGKRPQKTAIADLHIFEGLMVSQAGQLCE
jgi:hypothetical protein